MEQETGSHSGEGPEESLIVRCSDAVGGGRGAGAGTHPLNGRPTPPEITTHLAVLQGAALEWGSLICVHSRWIVKCRSCEM